MFHHGVQQGLRNKIRILALNSHLHLLKHFDKILVLEDGKAITFSTPEELFTTHRDVYERVLGLLEKEKEEVEEEYDEGDESEDMSHMSDLDEVILDENHAEGDLINEENGRLEADGVLLHDNMSHEEGVELSTLRNRSRTVSTEQHDDEHDISTKLIAAEKKDTHSVSMITYFSYFGSAFWNDDTTPEIAKSLTIGSVLTCFGILFVFLVTQVNRIYCDIVLLDWVDHHEASSDSVYYKIYLGCIASFLIMTAFRSCVLSFYATAICKSIHNMLFLKILKAPVPTFFDVMMVGNILNRFAKDMETTDVTIPEFLNMFLYQFFTLFSVVGLCIWSVPLFIVLVIPVVVFVVTMFFRFAPFSRDIKRLESVSRTPVYSSFSETLTGFMQSLDLICSLNCDKCDRFGNHSCL